MVQNPRSSAVWEPFCRRITWEFELVVVLVRIEGSQESIVPHVPHAPHTRGWFGELTDGGQAGHVEKACNVQIAECRLNEL
jgi:hypothetical protein